MIQKIVTNNNNSALSEVLCQAFVDDPAIRWMIPDEKFRRKVLPGFFKAMLIGAIRNGVVITSPDHRGVSLWRLPGRVYPGFLEMLMMTPNIMRFLHVAGYRAKELANLARANAPDFPCSYLQFIGTDPNCQGGGIGSEIILSGLEQVSNFGLPVYLETSNLQNVSWYEKFGFSTFRQYSPLNSNITVTVMITGQDQFNK